MTQKKPLQASEDESENGTTDIGCEPALEFQHTDLSLWYMYCMYNV